VYISGLKPFGNTAINDHAVWLSSNLNSVYPSVSDRITVAGRIDPLSLIKMQSPTIGSCVIGENCIAARIVLILASRLDDHAIGRIQALTSAYAGNRNFTLDLRGRPGPTWVPHGAGTISD
jgi:hypothetical protein